MIPHPPAQVQEAPPLPPDVARRCLAMLDRQRALELAHPSPNPATERRRAIRYKLDRAWLLRGIHQKVNP